MSTTKSETKTPLCPVHARIDSAGTLEVEIGGNACVACSLNERKELLDILAPFAAPEGAEDSVTVMRRVTDFYQTHVGDGRVVVSYPAPVAAPADAEQLVRLREAATVALKWMDWWLDSELCECDGYGHVCGKTERKREADALRHALGTQEGEQ